MSRVMDGDSGGPCLVCRCEDVTREEIERLIGAGVADPEDIKRLTRAGMGHCQGRTCRSIVMSLLASRGIAPERQTPPSVRQPSRPVALGALATAGDHADPCDMD